MRISLKKTIIVAIDIILGIYLVAAFTAFNKPDEQKNLCNKVNIEIADGSSDGFIDAKEIKKRLDTAGLYPLGKPMRYVDARKIENILKSSPFVKTAECYKTQDGNVFITITQLLPVIRIKADNGDDYYVDDKNSVMPNSNYTSDLIIATGNISKRFATNYMSSIGKTIMSNDLWKNMVEQIHVLPDLGIEIVPRIGDHIVYLGRIPEARRKENREKAIADFISTKMERLVKFYRYGMAYAGWNKYSYINIEFDNQIICKKYGGKSSSPVQHDIVQPQQANSPTGTVAPNDSSQHKQQKKEQKKEIS